MSPPIASLIRRPTCAAMSARSASNPSSPAIVVSPCVYMGIIHIDIGDARIQNRLPDAREAADLEAIERELGLVLGPLREMSFSGFGRNSTSWPRGASR